MSEAMRRALSLAALTVLEVSPAEQVRIAARCGYSHVGLRLVPATPGEPHVPIMAEAAKRRELRAVLSGEGVGVLDVEIVRLTEIIDWSMIEAVCACSEEFGASRLLVADNDPDPVRSKDSLARMAELGAHYQVMPHLEFMPWTCSPNLAAARDRIAGIANARLLIDAFHLVRSGGAVADLAGIAASIGYLQLCDIAGPIPDSDEILREARSDRLFPGEGEIDLAALLRLLPDIPVSLEVPADSWRDAGGSALERAQHAFDLTKALLDTVDAHA